FSLISCLPLSSTYFPYTTLFRSARLKNQKLNNEQIESLFEHRPASAKKEYLSLINAGDLVITDQDRLIISLLQPERLLEMTRMLDRKSTRLNSSHVSISYAVFCL